MNRQSTARSAWLLATALLFPIIACERNEPPPSTSPDKPAITAAPSADELAELRTFAQESAPPAPMNLPAGHPPIDLSAPPPAQQQQPTAALKYTAPDDWVHEPVTSSMRTDQYRLPEATDGIGDAELAVFYFGPGGAGGIEANLQRWRGQFSTDDGQPVPDESVRRENLQINDLPVTFIEIHGDFQPGAMAMGGNLPPTKTGSELLAAIVETPAGPWFFKAVGPEPTIDAHRAAFRKLLESIRYE